MTIFNDGADEFRDAAKGLAVIGATAVPKLRTAMDAVGAMVVTEWQQNATQTSGQHAKNYPKSIEATMALTVTSVAVDVGPVIRGGRGEQGFLGRVLEYGGEHSPPHLDGVRAMDSVEPKAFLAIDTAVGGAFK